LNVFIVIIDWAARYGQDAKAAALPP